MSLMATWVSCTGEAFHRELMSWAVLSAGRELPQVLDVALGVAGREGDVGENGSNPCQLRD